MQTITLLIDKRRELSTKYKKLLETSLNKVLISKDLISAIKTIQDTEPDLIIISDSITGDLSDYCKKIRAITYNMRPVIVAISKSDDVNDKLRILESGADDFISEPVNSEEFLMRMKAHLRREIESNLDLTKLLPQKPISLRALKRTINTSKEWATMLITIDNFQSYKEIYTELASDKLIQTFCAIIKSALDEKDYFGIFSENEFLLITDRYKVDKIANYITFAFETVSTKFYSAKDLERGYLILQGDDYAGRRADFVHVTIGVVTDEFSKFGSVTQVINTVIQTRNMAHENYKSNYLIERPKLSAENSVIDKEYNNKICIIEEDASMNLLLNTIFKLQGFKIVDKKEIPAVIILDTGKSNTQKNLKLCCKIKQNPKFSKTKIIVTSIFHDKETVLNSNADLYLPKPYEIPQLIKWVEDFVKEFNR